MFLESSSNCMENYVNIEYADNAHVKDNFFLENVASCVRSNVCYADNALNESQFMINTFADIVSRHSMCDIHSKNIAISRNTLNQCSSGAVSSSYRFFLNKDY